MKLRIVSDGTAHGTTVSDPETGKSIKNVTRIELAPIVPGKDVRAEITTMPVAMDVVVEGKVLRSADAHQEMKVGRFRLYSHDYDGDVFQIIEEGEVDDDARAIGILEKDLEDALAELMKKFG